MIFRSKPSSRVLNVNPDAAVRHALSCILARAGFQISEAETATGALQVARAASPDLVLLDPETPDLPVETLCRELRLLPGASRLPILLMSRSPAATGIPGPDYSTCIDGAFTWPTRHDLLVLTVKSLLRTVETQVRLEESEARYRATFEQSAVGLAQLKLQGGFSWVNRRLSAMLGYTRSELIQLDSADSVFAPGSQSMPARLSAALSAHQDTLTFEQCCHRRNGTAVWTYWSLSLLRDPKGQPLQFLAVVEEISLRKWVEENLRLTHAALDASTEPVTILDAHTRPTYHNSAFTRIYGSLLEQTSTPVSRTGLFAQGQEERIQQVLEEGQPWSGDALVKAAGGPIYPVELRLTPIRSPQGDLIGWTAVFADVTQRKQIEQAFRDCTAEVMARNQELRKHKELTSELQEQLARLRMELEQVRKTCACERG